MFPFFPYTNFHELNADWILKTVKNLADAAAQLADNLAHVVRVTAQTFTAEEQRIACNNIKAVSYHTQPSLPADRTIARANLQAVGYEAQTLTETQQTAARDNIGAASASDIPDVSDVVRYSPQDLTLTQQTRARLNIGATSQADIEPLLATKHYVKYDEQTLTEAQKAQARQNIGASQAGTVPAGAVRYDVAQTLTEAQKQTARENIGANSGSGSDDYVFVVSENEQGTGYDVTGNLSDAAQVTGRVFIVLEQSGRTREALAELSYTGGALSSVGASFADFFAVDSSIPNTITQVIITNSGATVTDFQQQQVPHPAPLGADAGKVLTATRNGAQWTGMLSITATITSATGGTWTGATWDAIKNNIQNGKVFAVTTANTGDLRYVMFNSISTTDSNIEIATSSPILMGGSYQSITVTSNGDFHIR